jgi:1,4-dihydroxy-2-naphthoyl-CoA hydrolase
MQFTQDHAAQANEWRRNTLVEHLGITYHVDGAGRFCATMPVEARTHQPMGLLHGGATAALAESLGSMASALLIDVSSRSVVGIEVSANHLRGVREGSVTAIGELVHHGRSTHVWDIRVYDEERRTVAVCRLTNLVIERR